MQVRIILRLDANRAQVAPSPQLTADLNNQEDLGDVEEAVISKWAGEDVGLSDDEDDDE